MKLKLCLVAALVMLSCPAFAQIAVPSDGSDGDFKPTADVTVDLSQAATGAWNSPGNGTGVYDPNKWAVVFKFRSVNVPNGVTVTFKNHPSRAPVVWLVSGDVTINGRVNVSGQDGTISVTSEPGPGGFRGGSANAGTRPSGGGFGPGGANRQGAANRSSGSYATEGVGSLAGATYGNEQILPLIGGSGGNGRLDAPDYSGGAGGGAILIAASGTITVNGGINADGGWEPNQGYGSGSGGAIRLIANLIQGNGYLVARGGAGNGYGGAGRIRVEANGIGGNLIPNSRPVPSGGILGSPPLIWPPDGAPTVQVTSVGASGVPNDPRASLGGVADVSLNETNAVPLVVVTTNAPTTSVVTIRVVPLFGDTLTTTATFASGNFAQAIWSANITLPQGYCAIQAKVEVK